MTFRDRLVATLHAVRPVLGVRGIVVGGSEVPNLLEPNAASTLVVSQDVDLIVPVEQRHAVVNALRSVQGLEPSADEPSVWVPTTPALIEVNFIGREEGKTEPSDTYYLDDAQLPLMVFGPLGLVHPGKSLFLGDLEIPMPRVAGLLVEKLLSDRTGEKGSRDLLVALGLLIVAQQDDLEEAARIDRTLPVDLRHQVRSALAVLSLMEPHAGVPDPRSRRELVAAFIARLEPL